jgi:hypothetical protein
VRARPGVLRDLVESGSGTTTPPLLWYSDIRKASLHGTHVGAYAAAVLEHPLPWTKMRHVYRLLSLVRRHGWLMRIRQGAPGVICSAVTNPSRIRREQRPDC